MRHLSLETLYVYQVNLTEQEYTARQVYNIYMYTIEELS